MAGEERLLESVKRTLKYLGPELQEKLAGLFSPKSLTLLAALFSVQLASHALRVGFIGDALAVAVLVVALGRDVVEVGSDMREFVAAALNATNEEDLERAAEHLAKALTTAAIDIGMIAAAPALRAGARKVGQYIRPRLGKPREPSRVEPVEPTEPTNAAPKGNLLSPAEKALVDRAKGAESKLGNVPSGKTAATVGKGERSLSGWSKRPGFADGEAATNDVMKLSEEMGYPSRPAGASDQGVPGRYNASHAEKQMAVLHPNEPISVSRSMCDECIGWFQRLAQHRGRVQVVADPKYVRVFRPDGTIIEIPR